MAKRYQLLSTEGNQVNQLKTDKKIRDKQWRIDNRERNRELINQWRKTPKGQASTKNSRFKIKYGLTTEEVEVLKSKQNGLCAICFEIPIRWCVDHNHETNEVRGLLCHNCNVALGHFKDNIKILKQALEYLSGDTTKD